MNSNKNKLNSKINWFFNLKPNAQVKVSWNSTVNSWIVSKSAVGLMNSSKNKVNSKINQ